jgi:integrase
VRLQFLKTALRWAVDQGMMVKYPKFPKATPDKRLPQPVPVGSFERSYAKAEGDAQMQAYLLTGWLAGLRLMEAYNLEWEETEDAPYVDLARNRIVLPGKIVKDKVDQWDPLDPALREALLALPRHSKKVFRFISTRTKQPLDMSGISDRVTDLAKKAGVRLTMHTLRKGFGCRYAGKVPAQVLQKLMRHRSIRTTMDYYVNVDQAVMKQFWVPDLTVHLTPRLLPRRSGKPLTAQPAIRKALPSARSAGGGWACPACGTCARSW